MTATYQILCDIGDRPNFLIGGQRNPVDFDEIEKNENLDRIYRFQFSQPPSNEQLERVVNAIRRRPEIGLRFYGNYSEDLIDWGKLTDIEDLQIGLWETKELQEISNLTNLKRLSITKNVKSRTSLTILEPLKNLETLYTSISKDVESIEKLKGLKFLSLREIKHNDLDFLSTLDNLRVLWLSLGSYNDFSGLSKVKGLQKLWVHQARGFDNNAINSILKDCKEIWALKLDNLKHITTLNFVPEMPNLMYLSLEGMKNLESFAPIKKSKTLETIAGYQCRPTDKLLGGLKNVNGIWLGDYYAKYEIDNLVATSDAENIWIRGKNLRGTGKLNNAFNINGR